MRIEELDYDLPPDLIADRPVDPRDSSRLMVVHRKTGQIEHRVFTDLPHFLARGDLLVLNSARVTPARLLAQRAGQPRESIEILVLDAGLSSRCSAWVSPARKIKPGSRLTSAQGGAGILVAGHGKDGSWELELEDGRNWSELLNQEGRIPLPPYILKRRSSKS